MYRPTEGDVSSPQPLKGARRLAARIRSGGLGWLRRRLYQETTLPTTRPGRLLHRGLRAAIVMLRELSPAARVARHHAPAGTLMAFYDLKVAPVTFDYIWFLCGAEIARARCNLQRIHIVIVPGPHFGVRAESADYEAVVGTAARRARILNMLVPAAEFVPTISGLTLAASRQDASRLVPAATHCYPQDYSVALPSYPDPAACLEDARAAPRSLAVLRAPEAGLGEIDQFIASHAEGRRLIVITLRAYEFGAARNSDLAAWTSFARRLDKSYFPVFVPDTQQTLEPLPDLLRGLAVFAPAAWNLTLRMALYERAYLNLGVSTGPMALCWFNPAIRYIMFKVITPSVPQATPAYLRSLGFEPGRALPFSGPFQKWMWQGGDSLEEIETEFAAMVARIDAKDRPPPTA